LSTFWRKRVVRVEKARGQGRDLPVQLPQPGLLAPRQARAGAHEVAVIAGEQLQRLGIEVQLGALLVERVHARPQRRVQVDRVMVRRELRRHLGVDLLHLGVGVAGIQIREHVRDARQLPPGALERDDRVLERGRRRVLGDGRDFR
jgi:hypothetical protein